MTVDVAVEQPTPVVNPSQVVPWTLVGGLTAQDFDVFSDGKACPVESFSIARAPLSMATTTGGAYAAVFGPEQWRPKRTDALAARPARLREGGEPLKPASIDEGAFKKWVGRIMVGFMDDLHGGYALGFLAPALDGQLHSLDVRVRKPGLKVRAMQRYFARPKAAD